MQKMHRSKTTTQTVFILEHHEGFFFFDPNKEGIVYDSRRFRREDINITNEKAVQKMPKMTRSLRIPIKPGSERWLPSFLVTEKKLWRRKKCITIKPLVVQTDTSRSLFRWPGISEITFHPHYERFELAPPAVQDCTEPSICTFAEQHA
jgi:hypothetical protein